MCITFCLVYHTHNAHSSLVYKNARVKVAIISFLVGLLVSAMIGFLIHSYNNKKPLWEVYPVQNNTLILLQLYLLFCILLSMIMMFVITLIFRWFVFAFIAATIFSVTSPLLSLLFLVHLLFNLHVFYLVAAKLTCEISLLFFYFYQGFEKLINDALNDD
uniref:Uncharacterized protein n=1 Tax=Cacopsylla melanoneura TaxID=428564 RepID=A0A8D8XBF3_9HEMI